MDHGATQNHSGGRQNGTTGMSAEELFETYDENGRVRGAVPRRLCHGNPALVHRTAHVIVFSSRGDLLLQKRSPLKDIQPGKWDTAVGGHLHLGEDSLAAARRELEEELGIRGDCVALTPLFESQIRNAVESENVTVFSLVHDGPFQPQAEEIDGVRFWSPAELRAALGTGAFTPNLEFELDLLFTRRLL